MCPFAICCNKICGFFTLPLENNYKNETYFQQDFFFTNPKTTTQIDSIFLNSPQYLSETFEAYLHWRLMLKAEIQNPLRSYKGRGADWSINQLQNNTPIIYASAGNLGLPMAYPCRFE